MALSQIHGSSTQHRCGHDGQRKRVAHMPTATTTTEDSRSKFGRKLPTRVHDEGISILSAISRRSRASCVSPALWWYIHRFPPRRFRNSSPTRRPAGGLMSYDTNQVDVFRQAASYVGRVLRGAKPADLPVSKTTDDLSEAA